MCVWCACVCVCDSQQNLKFWKSIIFAISMHLWSLFPSIRNTFQTVLEKFFPSKLNLALTKTFTLTGGSNFTRGQLSGCHSKLLSGEMNKINNKWSFKINMFTHLIMTALLNTVVCSKISLTGDHVEKKPASWLVEQVV